MSCFKNPQEIFEFFFFKNDSVRLNFCELMIVWSISEENQSILHLFYNIEYQKLALVFIWGLSAAGDNSAMAAIVVVMEEPKSESRIY